MKSKSRASLVLLCALIITFITDSSACDFTVEVGKSVTIKLGVDQTDDLTWNRDSERVFKGKVSTVSTKLDNVEVTSDGSLKIKSAKMKDNGKHDFDVFLPNGKSKTKKSIILCVHEKPPKPTVTITCTDGKFSISCEVKDQTGLTGWTFSWFRNEKKMAENSASLRNTDEDGEYECAVEKPISSEKSDKVSRRKTKCTGAGPGSGSGPGLEKNDDLLWGFERWIMISILAGGGGLVLLLMMVLVICACRSCKRREKRLLDVEELRLNFNASPHSSHPRSKNTARGQPAPPIPQEDPEVSNYEVDEPPPKTQPRSKKSPRPPPPPVDDDEQPPPLPQPRKNGPHGKKNQGPLYLQP